MRERRRFWLLSKWGIGYWVLGLWLASIIEHTGEIWVHGLEFGVAYGIDWVWRQGYNGVPWIGSTKELGI